MIATPRFLPLWVVLAAAGLGLLQPVVHLYTTHCPPAGAVPTGLGIADSALFLEAMEMFSSGFHSHYATCRADAGEASVRYYAVPHLWLYGVLGSLARALRLDPLLAYHTASGLGAAVMLLVVYRLLRTLVPAHAGRAFLLYALSAGPGGALYLLAGLAGLHAWPGFDRAFERFALYDLLEGPHLQPALYFPRLYYTLSLAGCLGGFHAIVRTAQTDRLIPHPGWFLPVMLGAFINVRFGVFTFGIVLLCLLHQGSLRAPWKGYLVLCYAVPLACGALPAALLMRLNPATAANHLEAANMAMWLGPFVGAAALHLACGWRAMRAAYRELPPWSFWTGTMAWGYCIAFALFYVLRQAYYGNLLLARDASVAAAVSDLALLGALAGAGVALIRPRMRVNPQPTDWMLLWLLLGAALSVSGWLGGWFLKFGPQRLQVMLWLPICVFAAIGLEAMRPRRRKALTALLLAFGAAGILTAAFAFQGPMGRTGARGPYAAWHPETMSAADAALVDALGPGTVLAPAPMGDVVVRRRGNPVVFGVGSFNLTDRPYLPLRADVTAFFAAATPDAERRAIAGRWCADWVVAPDTWPLDPAALAALDAAPWLERIRAEGQGRLYRMRD